MRGKEGGAAAGRPRVSGWLTRLVKHPWFERFIIAVIVLNAITLGLETSKTLMASYGAVLEALDHIMLAIFVAELLARMVVYRGAFWRDPWSWFDVAVVGIALLPATGELSVLRALRILRALRLISTVPSIRRVVSSLLLAIPSMGSIILLLLILNYVFAVMATKIFGADFQEHFGTIGASFFTFFQIMTLEGWSGEVVRPVMEKYPWAWVLFVPYIVLATFMVLNLFIGIVVDAMQQQQIAELKSGEVQDRDLRLVMDEIRALRQEIGHLGPVERRPGTASDGGTGLIDGPPPQLATAGKGIRKRKRRR
jgi:voltage-gated sodium channel